MKSLKELVEDPKVRQSVLEDSMRVLDEEVSKRSGIGGLAIKGAYKLFKNIQQGKALQKAMQVLMPEFIDKLDPYYSRYQKEGKGNNWIAFLRPHYESIADDLLSVTDGKTSQSDNAAVRKAYAKLRPKARKEVVASLPALARMMEKYIKP
jgi:hypothetical protein